METEKRTWAFDQAAGALPQRLRRLALTLPPGERAWAEELRLRAGQPLSVVFPTGERSSCWSWPPALRSTRPCPSCAGAFAP